jgi:beta-glucosidase
VVLVNAGSPVLMPWRDDVAAVLLGWFGGQEFGNAVADVLLGAVEPGGRLPTTWPAEEEHVPVLETTPTDGVLRYDEGLHIGYRAWLRAEEAPAYWFGHGLGYADVVVEDAFVTQVEAAGPRTLDVTVAVANRSDRAGKQVVQVYAERPDSDVERPVRWLVGFAPVRVPAGGEAEVVIEVPTRHLAHWEDGWQYEPGEYTLRIGTSAVFVLIALVWFYVLALIVLCGAVINELRFERLRYRRAGTVDVGVPRAATALPAAPSPMPDASASAGTPGGGSSGPADSSQP